MMFFRKFSGFLLATVLSLVFFSCQSEITDEQYSTKETITKTTPLTTYVERIVMQKTAQDNIIDQTDCFMVKFPYVDFGARAFKSSVNNHAGWGWMIGITSGFRF